MCCSCWSPRSPAHPARPRTGRKAGSSRSSSTPRPGLDSVDPALASTAPGWALLDTTCARLLNYPDKPPPDAFRPIPEVATDFPKVSADGKTYTFTLRKGFRFNDGTPVRASAFARAIHRTLAPGVNSPGTQHTIDIVGARAVLAGKRKTASGVIARGNTLIVRFTRPAPDFIHRTATTFFCAVKPTLPSDPEGVGAVPAAGPYYISEYRPGERVVLKRNPHYGGKRPHHVDGFEIDLRAVSPQEVLQRVEKGDADWGTRSRGSTSIPGSGSSRSTGSIASGSSSGPDSPCACSRSTPRDPSSTGTRASARPSTTRSTGARSSTRPAARWRGPERPVPARGHARLQRRRRLPARGAEPEQGPDASPRKPARRKDGALYERQPDPDGGAQLIKQQLAEIGLDVEVKGIPLHSASNAYFSKLAARGEPWDMALGLWQPSYVDPYAYINQLFAARYVGGSNFMHFASKAYEREMNRTARLLQGRERNRAYAALDVRIARDAAPLAALDFLREPTLISERVGCVVLRPVLDLTAVCLK